VDVLHSAALDIDALLLKSQPRLAKHVREELLGVHVLEAATELANGRTERRDDDNVVRTALQNVSECTARNGSLHDV